MHTVEIYAHIRRFVAVDGHSQREAAEQFGVSRDTVAKMMRHALPPGYRRSKPSAKPKLDGFTAWIDATLEADQRYYSSIISKPCDYPRVCGNMNAWPSSVRPITVIMYAF